MSCCCPPSCAIPSCPQPCCSQPCCSQPCCSPCSYPVGGIGSLSCCNNSCCNNSCCSSSCCGNSTSARCLGITSGANVSCLNQLPPSELVVQPPPFVMVIPGPVLSASCEPVRVGGYTACAGCGPCGRICNSPCC